MGWGAYSLKVSTGSSSHSAREHEEAIYSVEKRNQDRILESYHAVVVVVVAPATSRQGQGRGRGGGAGPSEGPGPHLVASILVEYHEKDGHDHDDADHNEGVQHGVEEPLAHRWRVLSEGRVDAEEVTGRDRLST